MEDKIRVLVPEKEVDEKIAELGRKISEDYAGRQVHLVCVLKGGVFFMCELAKRITVPVTMDFMSVSSYGSGTVSSGSLTIVKDLSVDCKGRNVLIVEDIVDTGITLSRLQAMLKARGAASVEISTLLSKPARRKIEVDVKYICFEIPDKFVIGYGLDFDERYRGLRDVCVLDEKAYM